jgi:hypothetical protein
MNHLEKCEKNLPEKLSFVDCKKIPFLVVPMKHPLFMLMVVQG